MQDPTEATYSQLNKAYSHFNKHLFDDCLDYCVITLHRKKGANGYFWGDTWGSREGQTITDEIALNPEQFSNRSIAEILSTLVHEMCHLQQHHHGKTSRNGYHNSEWANMMLAVGLIPSDTGKEGGKQTGQKMTHYIEPKGRFERVCKALIKEGFNIPWQAVTQEGKEQKKSRKIKYSCPCCAVNAWGKEGLDLSCNGCDMTLEPDIALELDKLPDPPRNAAMSAYESMTNAPNAINEKNQIKGIFEKAKKLPRSKKSQDQKPEQAIGIKPTL